jgi:xanthine dehydrogenase accessory factor
MSKSNLNPLEIAAKMISAGMKFAMVTIIKAHGSTPRKAGSRMIVHLDGVVDGSIGGGAVERLAIDSALESMKSGEIEYLKLNLNDFKQESTGMICGGNVELMIEPFGYIPRLLMFGGGHVAQPTAMLAHKVGFPVTIFDQREDWANEERFPAMEITHGATEEIAKNISTIKDDFIIVMTHCHDDDYQVITRVLRKPFYYLGVIGSEHKAIEIKKELSSDGFSDDEIRRMTCPIGLKIGSHTPDEIAISVAAQLVEKLKGWEKEQRS